jgi:hypothetical protein
MAQSQWLLNLWHDAFQSRVARAVGTPIPKWVVVYRLAALSARTFASERVAAPAAAGAAKATRRSTTTKRVTPRPYGRRRPRRKHLAGADPAPKTPGTTRVHRPVTHRLTTAPPEAVVDRNLCRSAVKVHGECPRFSPPPGGGPGGPPANASAGFLPVAVIGRPGAPRGYAPLRAGTHADGRPAAARARRHGAAVYLSR